MRVVILINTTKRRLVHSRMWMRNLPFCVRYTLQNTKRSAQIVQEHRLVSAACKVGVWPALRCPPEPARDSAA